MRRLLLLTVVVLLSFCGVAQNVEGMYSFIDYPISTIDIQAKNYSHIDSFVRKVDTGDEMQFYYVLKAVSRDSYVSTLSSILISYKDLEKINSALKVLLVKEDNDWKQGIAEIGYIENKYVTENGFGIGYCVNNGRLEWFIESDYYGAINGWRLEDRIIDNKAFSINNGRILEESFGKAQEKVKLLLQNE